MRNLAHVVQPFSVENDVIRDGQSMTWKVIRCLDGFTRTASFIVPKVYSEASSKVWIVDLLLLTLLRMPIFLAATLK